MNYKTKLFPWVSCNAGYIEWMADEAANNGYKEILLENCSYFFIKKKLVPYKFLMRVKEALSDGNFSYGDVLGEEDICSEEFILSLYLDEREVLMQCVMLLIESGDFPMCLFEEADEVEAA